MENIWTFPFGLCKILARVKGVLSGSGQKSDRCKFTCANMFRTHYVSTQTNKKFCSYVFEPQKKNQRIPKALQTISFSRNQFQRSAARSFYRGKLNVERFGFLWRNLYSRSRRCHFDVTGDPSDRSCYQQGWHQGIGSVSIPSCPCCRVREGWVNFFWEYGFCPCMIMSTAIANVETLLTIQKHDMDKIRTLLFMSPSLLKVF